MQTQITQDILASPDGQEADAILRNCVHCGFCTATCPTYLLLGNELDGPRGRIYQIKQLLEGAQPSDSIQQHLDACLLCRSCETTCPSGVDYHRLMEIGRAHLQSHHPRKFSDRAQRWLLRKILPRQWVFGTLLGLGRIMHPLLPDTLARQVPLAKSSETFKESSQNLSRRMLILEGCVQPSLAPDINRSTARVLETLGIALIKTPRAGCCGGVEHHLDDTRSSRQAARRNIDAWWPLLQEGAEALVITASGCGQMIKEYDRLLADDPDYADKAAQVAGATRDIAEILSHEDLSPLGSVQETRLNIAFHTPCTLQHGQGLNGVVEQIMTQLGFNLMPVSDSHLCCGSAGTYSILNPHLADRLGVQKSAALMSGTPDLIATANIGCLTHIAKHLPEGIPILHWIEVVANQLPDHTSGSTSNGNL
ncbi:MAG: glycolate oxidase subunit GlcF [Candidatus Thiodiazotropha sp.]